jgi:hypothetical protein
MTLILNISKEKRTRLLMHSVEEIHAMHATTISMCKSYLKNIILEVVISDEHYLQVKEGLQQENVQQKYKEYKLEEDGILMHKNRVYVPNSHELRKLVLKEMHNVPYVGHPGYQKTIAVVRSQYFWPGMKKDVVDYIARCMECQRVKVEHRHPTRFSTTIANSRVEMGSGNH